MSTRLLLALSCAIAVGCSGANSAESMYVDGVDSGATSATGTAVTGIPCEVATVLANKCVSCHGNPPSGGAPYSINSYEDLTKKSPSFSSETVAQRSVARMQDTTSPMPPTGGVTAAEIAAIQAWIDGGMLKGDCAATSDPGSNPWAVPPGCASGIKWNGRETATMRPGEACISCHTKPSGEVINPDEVPTFLGGTVYSRAHEVDGCNAVAADVTGLTVVIIDADKKEHRLKVNAAGNFMMLGTTPLPTPYSAKVVNAAGKERVMVAKQTSGDCNSCHTQDGAGDPKAPGRVLAP